MKSTIALNNSRIGRVDQEGKTLLSPRTIQQWTHPDAGMQSSTALLGLPRSSSFSRCTLSHIGASTPSRSAVSPQLTTLSHRNKSQPAQTTRKLRSGFQVSLSTLENSCITAFRCCEKIHMGFGGLSITLPGYTYSDFLPESATGCKQ